MRRQITISFLATVMISILTGCGQSTAALTARGEAHDRLNSMSANITYEQAHQAFQSGQFDRALREINSAIARFPKESKFHVLQGRIHMESQRLANALTSFLKARELDPENHRAHYYSGIVFQRWSDDEQAFECYHKASELDEANVHYLLASAESLIALGEFEQAEQLITPRQSYFEYNSALHQLKAQIAQLQNRPKLAAQRYAEARLLAPEDDSLLEELAWAQYAAEQYEECFESLRYLQYKAENERLDLKRLEAQCLGMLGRSEDARDIYIYLSRQLPNDSEIWIELGTVAWEAGDYRRVTESGTRLVSLSPNRFEGYLLKAIYEKHEGDSALAIDLMREALSHAGDFVAPHLLLGSMLEEAGIPEEALRVYRSALLADPKSVEAQMMYDRLERTRKISSVPTD